MHASPLGSSLPSPGSERGPLAPHAAWEALLTTRLPFLLSENQAAADFLGLIKTEHPSPSSQAPSPGVYRGHCQGIRILPDASISERCYAVSGRSSRALDRATINPHQINVSCFKMPGPVLVASLG